MSAGSIMRLSERNLRLVERGRHDRDGHQSRRGRVPRPAAPVDQDQTALAAALLDEQVDGDFRRIVRVVGVLEIAQRAVAEDDTDDRLAVAGARHAAEGAVGVCAAADQRAVADATRELARRAAGRRGGSDRAAAVERDRADGAATGRYESPCELGVTLALPVGDERGRIALRNPDGTSELERAVAPQQDVTPRLEHLARGADWVRNAYQSRDRPALQPIAFHDRRVRLDRAVPREYRAATRVEAWIVLECAHGALHRVECGATADQYTPARQHGGVHARAELGRLGRIGAGAAVDNDRGNPGRHCLHRVTIPSDCKILARSRS